MWKLDAHCELLLSLHVFLIEIKQQPNLLLFLCAWYRYFSASHPYVQLSPPASCSERGNRIEKNIKVSDGDSRSWRVVMTITSYITIN